MLGRSVGLGLVALQVRRGQDPLSRASSDWSCRCRRAAASASIHFAAGATPIWLAPPSSPTMVPMVWVPWPKVSHGVAGADVQRVEPVVVVVERPAALVAAVLVRPGPGGRTGRRCRCSPRRSPRPGRRTSPHLGRPDVVEVPFRRSRLGRCRVLRRVVPSTSRAYQRGRICATSGRAASVRAVRRSPDRRGSRWRSSRSGIRCRDRAGRSAEPCCVLFASFLS